MTGQKQLNKMWDLSEDDMCQMALLPSSWTWFEPCYHFEYESRSHKVMNILLHDQSNSNQNL